MNTTETSKAVEVASKNEADYLSSGIRAAVPADVDARGLGQDDDETWKLVSVYGNACFECGEWSEDNSDYEGVSYGVLMKRTDEARNALKAELARLRADAEGLAAALRAFDGAFTGFDPTDRDSRHDMRRAVIAARAALEQHGAKP